MHTENNEVLNIPGPGYFHLIFEVFFADSYETHSVGIIYYSE